MKSKNVIILLTACVNPKGMSFTKLQDADERIKQYSNALKFYLEETDFNIVIVENTLYEKGFDVDDKRVEYLTFDGNNYDKSLGKGYGEALIIEHALEKSTFLKNADYIIKITGRLQIKNIVKIIKSLKLNSSRLENIVFSNITWNMKFCYSNFFISNRFFLNRFLDSKKNINDSKTIFFENILMNSIIDWKKDNNNFSVLKFPIIIEGFSGSTGESYSNKLTSSFLFVTQYFKSFYFNSVKQWK
ncbi:hypothetical protein [Flavobacterium pectinovorum]|uniref:hypothetical protein n=1 Tax=Flavobacterium pectinovorum TaxID=29533 RepID=UPI001FAD437B|nr:hypothetical protein [Flavobacterium pectinovorum]MCI9843863.1 hypothetical protein [Flavobacterium pectinovorum]